MSYVLDFFRHRRDCRRKQAERSARIANLPAPYHQPLTGEELKILGEPIEELVQGVQSHAQSPVDVVRAYGKVAVAAHERTNCLTEVLLPEAEDWATGEVNLQGPLAGVPVSLKDTVHVRGFDTSVGYSCHTGKPQPRDGILIRLLKEAGAVPFTKTNVPVTLLSFESTNDVWGRCKNPHNTRYSPGGSTGGEAALLAYGGSRIGIGTDVAGSVRVPAHYSGCYSLRCSTGRWPRGGGNTSMAGQEGVMAVYSPMGRTLHDLTYFTRSLLQMRPWRLDHSLHPLEWRSEDEREVRERKKLRVGVMRTDGVVDPSPACARALQETVAALQKEGHDVVDLSPPSPFEGLRIASVLLNSDGCRTFRSFFRPGEWMDAGAAQLSFFMRLPRVVSWFWAQWVRYVRRDSVWADLLDGCHEKSAFEQWKLVARREAYRANWHAWWQEEAKIDFLLTPPNAMPAVPHDGMRDAMSNCNYTFLFNLLDYPCGVLPVTHVDGARDMLPPGFNMKSLNGVAKGAYMHYDAIAMNGLPVGVQVVGQRLREEKVLAYMERVEEALEKHNGGKYKLLEPYVTKI